jgi:hypothetical protein
MPRRVVSAVPNAAIRGCPAFEELGATPLRSGKSCSDRAESDAIGSWRVSGSAGIDLQMLGRFNAYLVNDLRHGGGFGHYVTQA